MTGSGLIDFIITLLVVFGTAALFFVAIDRAAPDPLMKKIGQIAVGVLLGVIVLLAVKAVLFGGGGAISMGGRGIIVFAIGIIVLFVVLFLLDKVLQAAGSWGIPGWIVEIVRYVVFAVALIALLVLADRTFFGGAGLPSMGEIFYTPSIMVPEKK